MSPRTLVQRSVLAIAMCSLAQGALAQAPAPAAPAAAKPAAPVMAPVAKPAAPAMAPVAKPAAPAHAAPATPAVPAHAAPAVPAHAAPATPAVPAHAAPAVPATPPAAAVAEAKPLAIDTTHSRIGFVASTVLFDVDGKFEKYEVLLEGEPTALPKAKVKVVIEAASIDTDNEKRDEHLRSPDFFDAKQFPKLTFTGVLAMHGKEKTVTIKFKRAHGKNGAGVDATTLRGKLTIKRSEFGIGTDSIAAKISLEDEVVLDLLLVALI
jgi:polyisoprenoid-binding protein YceI